MKIRGRLITQLAVREIVLRTNRPDNPVGRVASIQLPGATSAFMIALEDASNFEDTQDVTLVLEIRAPLRIVDVSDLDENEFEYRQLPPVADPAPPPRRILKIDADGLVVNTKTGARARLVDFAKLKTATGGEFNRAVGQLATALDVPWDEAQAAVLGLVDDKAAELRLMAISGNVSVAPAQETPYLADVVPEVDPEDDYVPATARLCKRPTTAMPVGAPLYVTEATTLLYQSEVSDKVYHVLIVNAPRAAQDARLRTGDDGRRYRVVSAWGKRGARLQWQDRTDPTALPFARNVAADLVARKTGAGYVRFSGDVSAPVVALPAGFVRVDTKMDKRAAAATLRAKVGAKRVVDGELVDEVVRVETERGDMKRGRQW